VGWPGPHVTVGSATTLFSGYTVLCSAADGSIAATEHGLFHRDARVLSRHRLTVGDASPRLVAASRPESDQWVAVLRIPRPGGSAAGPQLPQDALEIEIRRHVGPGMTESIDVTNRSGVACATSLRLDLDADFADVAELGRERRQQGTLQRLVDEDRSALTLRYDVSSGDRADRRAIRVRVLDGPADVDELGLSFRLDLRPGGTWRQRLEIAVLDGGAWRAPVGGPRARDLQRRAWRRRRPALSSSAALSVPFERAADDLFDLRNWELEDQILGRRDGASWIVNAGIPRFTGLFGRDVVTAGWQAAMLGPRALAGALDALAATQAVVDDPWRDAEPGKMIHELRSGPLAALGLTPRDAYYGSQTTPAMFVLALSELWHWTGDEALLHRHLDAAVRALEWGRSSGDLDGDGFLEYQRRSPEGLRNQAWKDSDEAIRNADGSIADGPIATVEEQAFHVLALERMAEILVALDESERAEAYLDRARTLRSRCDEAFWMPDTAFYAMALDGEKRQVRSIGSNPGHALGAGIPSPDRARAVADRLMASDMFSGWGIRSLSDRHPSYNPFAYHLGCVWPVEQATFALGFKRYGFDDHLDRLADGLFAAAAADDAGRLPEALAGHGRDAVPHPVPYPEASVPQAWSASAVVQLVQIMLGLYPFAPLKVLAVVGPRLPAWAPHVTLRGLRVGRAVVDLEFQRRSDGSAAWRVARRRGALLVIGAGPPDTDDPSWFERLELATLDRAPGRLARAARIAIGR
jgi:glycogen debranching enzyme